MVLITTIALCSYPASYLLVRALGVIVHASWIGPDGLRHEALGYSFRPVDRLYRPLVRLESRLRHFEDP